MSLYESRSLHFTDVLDVEQSLPIVSEIIVVLVCQYAKSGPSRCTIPLTVGSGRMKIILRQNNHVFCTIYSVKSVGYYVRHS
jgi:hypothetical protein